MAVESQVQQAPFRIAIIGAGTIGLSFAALHILNSHSSLQITIHDPRPDIKTYVETNLPSYLGDARCTPFELRYSASIEDAVTGADIVQEQGPESLDFKQRVWPEVELYAPKSCLLWSSTSGIKGTDQGRLMSEPGRLLVVHPFNPPHVMPILEIVTTPASDQSAVLRTVQYWESLGRKPVVLKKEVTGFVANRLAFALLKEAIALVQDGVVSVKDLDTLVETSMGPRWAIAGPFKSYHIGGGAGGLEGFINNIGGTVQSCWDDAKEVKIGENMDMVYEQTREAYGDIKAEQLVDRDTKTKKVLAITQAKP